MSFTPGQAFSQRPFTGMACWCHCSLLLSLIGSMGAASMVMGGRLFQPIHDGNFYQIIPAYRDVRRVVESWVYSRALALVIGFLRFWHNVGETCSTLFNLRRNHPGGERLVFAQEPGITMATVAACDRGKFGVGSAAPPPSPSMDSWPALWRLLSAPSITTFSASTARPDITSLPVIFGTVGGIGLILGPIGLLALLKRRNKEIDDESQTGMDLSFHPCCSC